MKPLILAIVHFLIGVALVQFGSDSTLVAGQCEGLIGMGCAFFWVVRLCQEDE